MTKLTVTKPLFIGNEMDVDREPEQKSLTVPAAVWNKVVAAAELGGFRSTRGHIAGGDGRAFTAAVRKTLATRTTATRASALGPEDFVREFLSVQAHSKVVQKVLALIDEGNGLSVAG